MRPRADRQGVTTEGEQVTVRLTPREVVLLRSLARLDHSSLAGVLRQALRASARRRGLAGETMSLFKEDRK